MNVVVIIYVVVVALFLIGFYTILELKGKVEILEFRNDYLKRDVEYYKTLSDDYFKAYINEMRK